MQVLDNHEREISNEAVKTILKKRGFFDDIRILSDILELIKKAIPMLEGSNVTLADCYVQMLKLAAMINRIPSSNILKTTIIRIYNRRYKEFDHEAYLLSYYLHPLYRGMFVYLIIYTYFIIGIY